MLKLINRLFAVLVLALATVSMASVTSSTASAATIKSGKVTRANVRYKKLNRRVLLANSPATNLNSIKNEVQQVRTRHFTTNMTLLFPNGSVWNRISASKYAGKWVLEPSTNLNLFHAYRLGSHRNRHIVGALKVRNTNLILSRAVINGKVYYAVVAAIC